MMVEYTHLPDSILTTVMPEHFGVDLSVEEGSEMMSGTERYSKVLHFEVGEKVHLGGGGLRHVGVVFLVRAGLVAGAV